MADNSTGSPTSSGSHYASPETYSDMASSNASPVSASPSLYTARPLDEAESSQRPTAEDTATRPAAEVTRSHSGAGKGGCWTCRLRRKKCDEERDYEGGPCKTCRRLGIECLGWGARRPDWMRDKEKVAAYKASIKEQLTRAGLIRGQPRQPYTNTASTPHTPAVAGPGPSSVGRFPVGDARYPRPYGSRNRTPSGSMPAITGSGSARRSPTDLHYGSTMSPVSATHDPYHPPMFPYNPAGMSSTLPILPNDESLLYTPYPSTTTPDASTHTMGMPQTQVSVSVSAEDYVIYYFDVVRKVQYVFAGNSLTNALYSIVVADPRGAVANTICALSSLHYANVRIAQGIEVPRMGEQQALSKQYYEQARYQLLNSRNLQGQYTESDAVAAVQLVSYSVFCGWGDWGAELEVACDWLTQTGIHQEQNPKLTLLNMNAVAKFAAKATMWIDVLSSVSYGQPPRFLSLYRRLFGGGAGFWANTHQGDIRMDALTGCPEEAMLAIAEISGLAHWKATELRNGSLSVRDLIRRGDQIETQLRQRSTPRHLGEGSLTPLDPNLAATTLDVHLPMAMGMPSAPSSSSSSLGMHGSAVTKDEASNTVADIFREAAVLYLHTILSDALPAVPEISSAVAKMTALLNSLPPSEYDRAIMFPLFLMGSMTDDRGVRELVKRRLMFLDDTFGNVTQVLTQLESIWSDRSALQARHGTHVVVHWRERLRNQWANLLLL